LIESGLFRISRKLYGEIGPAFYGLPTTLLTLLLMALLRIKRPEHLSGRGKLQRLVEAAAIAAEIARVRWLSGSALRRRWQAVFGRSPPVHLTAGVMSFARSVSLIPSVPGGRCGVIPGG
jgi:hypothetical protein